MVAFRDLIACVDEALVQDPVAGPIGIIGAEEYDPEAALPIPYSVKPHLLSSSVACSDPS